MAKTNAILAEDRSAAGPVALAVLCTLALVQGALLLQSVWTDLNPPAPGAAIVPVAATVTTAAPQTALTPLPPLRVQPSASAALQPPAPLPAPAAVPSSLPPTASMTSSGLPPLPSLPSTLPPVPSSGIPSPKAMGLAPSLPVSPRSFPPLPPIGSSPSRVASSPPQPSATRTIPKTGDPRADELIEVAVQSRELNDPDGALKALEQADLILPDNPVVLREKAITYGKLGRADKAQAYWDRVSRLGPGAGTTSAFSPPGGAPPTPESPGSLNSAFASLGGGGGNPAGPLSLGSCQVVRDATVVKGQKFLLKIPVKAQPGLQVAVSDWNLDVLFYDRVDTVRFEPTNADPVALTFDMPVNFQSSEEVVTAVYHMPELTSQEMANIGHREFGGYVVKLYYKNRLMSTAASPRELLGGSSGQGASSAPVANPLLPPLPK